MANIRIFLLSLLALVLIAVSCAKEKVQQFAGTVISVSLPTQDESRTYIGPADASGVRHVYWSSGDVLGVNGFSSDPLPEIGEGVRSAQFQFSQLLDEPYNILYPASIYKDENTVTLPDLQGYRKGSFARNVAPAIGYAATAAEPVILRNPCAVIKLNILKGSHEDNLKGLIFTGGNGEQVSGEFTVDYQSGTLAGKQSTKESKRLKIALENLALSASEATEIYIVVPAGTYSQGFKVRLVDVKNHFMDLTRQKSIELPAKKVLSMATVAFEPTGTVIDVDASDFGGGKTIYFSGGEGTQQDPYIIASAADLLELAKSINESTDSNTKFKQCYYSQTADIDMSGINTFQPIGITTSLNFRGHYNGNNHKISNLSYHNTTDGGIAALFGNCGTGTELSNIVLENVTMENDSYYAGAVAAYLYSGTMTNCSASGTIYAAGSAPSSNVSYAGGLCGRMYASTISNSTFSGSVSALLHHVGGIVGDSDGKCRISGCKLEKGASVGGNYHVGGIISTSNGADTEISNCICAGDVHAANGSAGGIVATFYYGTIRNCVQSSASRVVCGASNAGGIAGQANANSVTDAAIYIDNCAVYGTVSGQYQVGGITGLSYSNNVAQKVVISNCACIGGAITATGINNYNYSLAAGICGYQQGPGVLATVNCFTRPAFVNANSPSSIGGISALLGYDNNAANKLTNGYSSASASTIQCGGQPVASTATCTWYGSIVGRASAAVPVTNCHYLSGVQMTPSGGSQVVSGCNAYTATQMTDGTMLAALNSGKSTVTEATPANWIAGTDGYPTLSGLPQDPYPNTEKKIRVSIIGDSISTFQGWIPAGYNTYYPKSDCDITSAALTYWYKLIYNYMQGAEFDTNIAFSNSTVVYNTYYGKDDQYKYLVGKDFCNRFISYGGMGQPDVILINGGTNDQGHNAGEYLIGTTAMLSDTDVTASAMSSLFTAADACKTYSASTELPCLTFAEAYVKLVRMMKLKYPSTRVVCIMPEWVKYKGLRSVIKLVAQHYGAKYVVMPIQDNVNIPKYNGCHPNAAGMEYMAKFIYNYECEGVKVGPWMEGK